jgi:hypothetical protein
VYLRDTDEPHETLVIDQRYQQGEGWTPLGLPGQTTFTIPDAVLIRGDRQYGVGANVAAEHAGLVLDFQNTLTIQDYGRLSVDAAAFVPRVAPTMTAGGLLQVAGAFTPPVPLTVIAGGRVAVTSTLTLNVPLTLTGGSLQVDGTLTSSLPLTVSASNLTADRIVAPALSVTSGGVLTSLTSTETRMRKLEVQVAGTLLVDATSRIDVSGNGYLAGRTTGNTTVGGATGAGGGSYGGRGGIWFGSTNALYGDFADPDDWGSGGAHLAGGGLVRVTAGTFSLGGRILANGFGGGGGAGAGC